MCKRLYVLSWCTAQTYHKNMAIAMVHSAWNDVGSPALSITIFMLVKDNDGKMQMIMTKKKQLQSHYQTVRSVCRQSVELETEANIVLCTHHTALTDNNKTKERNRHIFAGNALQLFSLPIFSVVCFFGKFPLCQTQKYAIDE